MIWLRSVSLQILKKGKVVASWPILFDLQSGFVCGLADKIGSSVCRRPY